MAVAGIRLLLGKCGVVFKQVVTACHDSDLLAYAGDGRSLMGFLVGQGPFA